MVGIWWLVVLVGLWTISIGEASAEGGEKEMNQTMGMRRGEEEERVEKREGGRGWYERGRQEMKKIPKFSSWGGKRSCQRMGECIEEEEGEGGMEMDKRNRFSSWGGKREWFAEPKRWRYPKGFQLKRTRFSSWGGKRSEGYVENEKEKRGNGFSSWGGKRGGDPDGLRVEEDWGEGKRSKFSSWGGKRGGAWDEDPQEEKRTRFSSWGGKRNQGYPIKEEKRAKFNSWGGKRESQSPPPLDYVDGYYDWILRSEAEEKGTSNLTEGLERELEEILLAAIEEACTEREDLDFLESLEVQRKSGEVKRVPFQAFIKGFKRKPLFSSWGGKRRIEGEPWEDLTEICSYIKMKRTREEEDGDEWVKEEEKRSERYPAIGGKRRTPFSSWGGKRDPTQGNNHFIQKRSIGNEKKLMEVKENEIFTNYDPVYSKRSIIGSKKSSTSRLYTKNIIRDGTWTAVLRPIRRGSDFYPWGGKRSST